jgi:hypothetical protein
MEDYIKDSISRMIRGLYDRRSFVNGKNDHLYLGTFYLPYEVFEIEIHDNNLMTIWVSAKKTVMYGELRPLSL